MQGVKASARPTAQPTAKEPLRGRQEQASALSEVEREAQLRDHYRPLLTAELVKLYINPKTDTPEQRESAFFAAQGVVNMLLHRVRLPEFCLCDLPPNASVCVQRMSQEAWALFQKFADALQKGGLRRVSFGEEIPLTRELVTRMINVPVDHISYTRCDDPDLPDDLFELFPGLETLERMPPKPTAADDAQPAFNPYADRRQGLPPNLREVHVQNAVAWSQLEAALNRGVPAEMEKALQDLLQRAPLMTSAELDERLQLTLVLLVERGLGDHAVILVRTLAAFPRQLIDSARVVEILMARTPQKKADNLKPAALDDAPPLPVPLQEVQRRLAHPPQREETHKREATKNYVPTLAPAAGEHPRPPMLHHLCNALAAMAPLHALATARNLAMGRVLLEVANSPHLSIEAKEEIFASFHGDPPHPRTAAQVAMANDRPLVPGMMILAIYDSCAIIAHKQRLLAALRVTTYDVLKALGLSLLRDEPTMKSLAELLTHGNHAMRLLDGDARVEPLVASNEDALACRRAGLVARTLVNARTYQILCDATQELAVFRDCLVDVPPQGLPGSDPTGERAWHYRIDVLALKRSPPPPPERKTP